MKLILLLLLAATLIEVYPNPYGSDEAEYVKFHCDSHCLLTDGEAEIYADAGTHIAAKNLSYFEEMFGYKADIPFPSKFALSNSGEEICLIESNSNHSTDCFYYGKDIKLLDDGVIYYRTNSGWDFRYEDWSSFSCVNETVKGRVIITPSNFTLDDGWTVASYTFHAPFNPSKLFVDGKTEAPCREVEANAVFLKSDSYRHFHYKFAVKGNKVVITTENWQFNKKGFIVVFESQKISNLLLKLLENDAKYSSTRNSCSNWRYFRGEGRKEISFNAPITVFILPDCNPVLDFISSARHRLYIIAPYMDFGWYKDDGLLDAIERAKENGAEVKVILSSEYAKPEAVESLRKESIDVIFTKKLHGKAIISDSRVLITSANMNMYGLKMNRELGVIIDDSRVSDTIAREFTSFTASPTTFNVSPLDVAVTFAAFLISVVILRRMKDKL